MLKLQLTLFLQLFRCPGYGICYKNQNRVTPTRPDRPRHAVTRHPDDYFHTPAKFVQVGGLTDPPGPLPADVDHGSRGRHEPRLSDVVARFLVVNSPLNEFG